MAVLIKAHSDGSHTGGVVAIVTCAAPAEAWDDIEPNWQATVARHKFPSHLSTFLAKEKDPDKRVEVLGDLVRLLNESVLMIGSCVSNVADFALLPECLHVRVGNQYLTGVSTAIFQTQRWAVEHGYPAGLAIVVEAGDEGQELFQDAMHEIIRRPESFRRTLGVEDIVFAPKGRAGFGMADLVAWSFTHHVPELRLDDEIARFILGEIRPEIDIKRQFLTKPFLVSLAHRNTIESLRELEHQHGFDRRLDPVPRRPKSTPPPPTPSSGRQRKRGR